MNRIDKTFASLAATKRKGLVPFITCGDPSLDTTVPVLHALVAAGADLIELGVPFSDPQADGPVIQRSSERALRRGVGMRAVLQCVAEFRRHDSLTPIVLMGYLNPIEVFGADRFASAAADAGVDGVLWVDCPPEEGAALRLRLAASGIHMILLAAPTTNRERLAMLAAATQGYLYYVAFAGVTGAAKLDPTRVADRVAAIRTLAQVPVAVGFGVKDAASARAIALIADAVVIGSALVERLAETSGPDAAARSAQHFLKPIRAALDAG